jgi:hypothetical protein
MNNRTEGSRHPAQPEQTIPSGSSETAGKPAQPCPDGNTWCGLHEHDACWSRTILVAEAELAINNGTTDGSPKLWGLDEFKEDGLPLKTAREAADAITVLLDDVDRFADPVGTENDECIHAWCEWGDEHPDHSSAGFYVPATAEPADFELDLDKGGTRVPVLRVFRSSERDQPAHVTVNLSGPGVDHDVELTQAEARRLQKALGVMLRHRGGRTMSAPCAVRSWCIMADEPAEHDAFHSGDAVDLAGATPDLSAGWWGWLFENDGEPLMLTVEGHRRPAVDVSAEAAAVLLAATATPDARQALVDLLASAGVEA